jgi:two-component system, OmpR family, sensor histidine kinase ResE
LAVQQTRIMTLSHLISNVSHDFKTPLAIINTSVYLLRRQLETKAFEHRLQKIQDQSMRLDRYIEGILTLSQLDKEAEFPLQILNPDQLLKPLEFKFQAIAEQRDIQLVFHWNYPSLLIMGHSERLTAALSHLLNNALIYNREGGKVIVQSHLSDHRLLIEITDTGIGIDPAHHSHIFEPFYRADSARGGEAGGIGLGLAIVQKVIELHRGTIEMESQFGHGSTFRVFLPVLEQAGPF